MKHYLFLIVVAMTLINAQPFQEKQTMELRPLSRIQVKERMQRDLLGNAGTHTQRHLLANDRTHTNTMKQTQHDLLANVGTYIHTLDKQTQQDIMTELIEEHLTEDNAKLVLNFVSRQPEDLLYAGYLKFFETIKTKSLKDSSLFELANQVKTDLNKGQVSSLTSLFPKVIWSLFISSVSCIRNKARDEYFYAEGLNYTYDKDRRHVFTWTPHGLVAVKGQWRFEYIGGNRFYIKSNSFDEYLFAEEDTFNFNSDRRRIFTWRDVWLDDTLRNVWELELLDGKDVFIRNVKFYQCIYSYDGIDGNRRMVFAWIPDNTTCNPGNSKFRWDITAC